MSWGRGHDDDQTIRQDSCQETTVQDCDNIYKLETTGCFFLDEASGHFPAVFVETEPGTLRENLMFSWHLPSGICA